MREGKQLYSRLDAWARNLSRLRYATFVGIVSCLCYLLSSAVFGEVNIIGATTIGITLAALFFAFDPNEE